MALAILLGAAAIGGLGYLLFHASRRQASAEQAGLPAEWEARQHPAGHYQLRYRRPQKGKHSQPSMLSLRTATAARIDLQLSRESWFDRLCKSLGIAAEFQIGDRAFDAAWYLRGEVDARVGLALRHGELRDPLRRLMASGFTGLSIEDGQVQVDWTAFDPARDALPGEGTIGELLAFARELPAGGGAQSARRFAPVIVLWLVVLAFGTPFLLGTAYPPVRAWDLWRWVLPAALVGWCAFAWIAAFVLRGRSRSHDQWLLLVLAALLSCTLGARGLLGWWNGHADPAPEVLHEVSVSQLWTTRHKRRTTYRLAIPDWRGSGTLEYTVPRELHASLREGASRVTVGTRAGRLGVEWETRRRIVP